VKQAKLPSGKSVQRTGTNGRKWEKVVFLQVAQFFGFLFQKNLLSAGKEQSGRGSNPKGGGRRAKQRTWGLPIHLSHYLKYEKHTQPSMGGKKGNNRGKKKQPFRHGYQISWGVRTSCGTTNSHQKGRRGRGAGEKGKGGKKGGIRKRKANTLPGHQHVNPIQKIIKEKSRKRVHRKKKKGAATSQKIIVPIRGGSLTSKARGNRGVAGREI